jgi:hypothetical protein
MKKTICQTDPGGNPLSNPRFERFNPAVKMGALCPNSVQTDLESSKDSE